MAIPTPYSYRQYTGDGAAKTFSVPFPYLARDHVHLYLDQKELVAGTDFTWTSGTQVQLTTAPQGPVAGTPPTPAEVLTVRRITPEDLQIVQWRDGSYIIQDDLNESDLQWLYLIQEHHDQIMILTWGLGGSGTLPGPGSPGISYSWWNNLARNLDPKKGTADELANTVDTKDQKTPDATGLLSDGWVLDDKHVATTGAISERLDVIMSDSKPADPPLSEYRQGGKFWVDTTNLQISYWDAGVRAWVNTGATGPTGPAGTVTVGTTTTGAAGTNAAVTNSGTATAAILDFVIPQGADGAPGPQGPQGLPGPSGTGADITFVATPPITVTEVGTSPKTVTYGFNITPLATLP